MSNLRHGRVAVACWTKLCFLLLALPGYTQTNDWISPISGDWDTATNWSVALPNSSQSEVRIANPNSKAVAIQPDTPVTFPGSLFVQNLRLAGLNSDTNVLLLNFFGTTMPLRVLGDFNIDRNGRVLLLYSGLSVNNAINLHGIIDQEGGQLTFTNSPSSTMQVEGGQFNLTNGLLQGVNMFLGGTNDGFVNHSSGLVALDTLSLGYKPSPPGVSRGTYTLQSGWLIVGHEDIGAIGTGILIQNDGTNSAGELLVGKGYYLKYGGGIFAGELSVVAPVEPIFALPSAIMTHVSGTATITNSLRLVGQGNRTNPRSATFRMLGGSMITPRIQLEEASSFVHSNGIVNVTSELFVSNNGGRLPGDYYFFGGKLFAANTSISSGYPEASSFTQYGGTHVVTNSLSINGNAIYQLSGGTVTVAKIVLTGNLDYPPQFFATAAPPFAVTNDSISSLGGAIVIENSAQQLGRLAIQGDSGINLAGNSAILRFADSHTNSWLSQLQGVTPRLIVFNWNGETNSGGADRLVFGASGSALTASQVAQIQFVNPAGFPAGTYPSQIRSTGEVVPVPLPALTAQKNESNLALSWQGDFILQGATNILGPYFDVTNAPSPYIVDPHEFPMRFFRLRR